MADRDPLLESPGMGGDENKRPAARLAIGVSADGYLKKRNRYGFWQKRFFELDGVDLRYYSDKKKTKPRPALHVLSAALSGRFGDFDVETETRDLELRADNLRDAELWVQAIETAEEEEAKRALERNRAPKPKGPIVLTPMEGYLELPSGVRYKPWHDRFCRLGHGSLFFYEDDSKAQDDYEGEILLNDATSPSRAVVELSEGTKNRGFLVRVGQKEYKFKAPSADAAKDWIAAIEQRTSLGGNRVENDEEKSELPSSGVPKWIQDWDAEPEAEHILRIQEHLNKMFPSPGEADFQKKTLNAVTTLLDELDDKARECLPANGTRNGLTVSQRESRPDIFEFIIRFFHIRIIDELSQFVGDQTYGNLTVRELLRFMDLITAYDSKIKEILQGEVGAVILSNLPRFDLLDNAENMALRYSRVCEQQINAWVENVIVETAVQGERRVFVRVDGRYQTPGPTDVFNMMDQALQLGRVSGVKRLQAEIVSMCAIALGVYMASATDSMIRNATNGINNKKQASLPLACAMANDCWSILEHIEKLETEHKNDAYRVEMESIQERCAVCADKCLELLSVMVVSDLRPTLEQLFTDKHLASVLDTDDYIAVVCATIDDYLEDLQVLLEIQFVLRVSRMIVRDVISSYLARLAHSYAVDRRVALNKREINLVDLDRKRILDCLQGRFPTMDIPRIFATELQPLEDVIEMMRAAPALVPQMAVHIAQRDSFYGPYLRQNIINTAKMCVDLSVNGQGGNDRLVKEIKALIVTEVEDAIPSPPSTAMPEDKFDLLERMAFTRMWPQTKKPAVRRTEGDRPVNYRALFREQVKLIPLDVPAERKPKPIQRDNSVHWQQFNRGGDAPAPVAEVTTAAPVILTPLVTGMLRFKRDAQTPHASYFCSMRPISENHLTDYELVVFNGKSASNPQIYRVRVADIARVSFWDDSGPRHFGSDGKVVEDIMPIGVIAGKNAIVDFAVAKNASEFVVVNRSDEKVHLKADSAAEAQEWVNKIRETVEDSFEKWGITFVEGQEQYAKMKVSQLLELGRKRGLDMRNLKEKIDLIRVLKNNAPLLPTATPVKAPEKPAVEPPTKVELPAPSSKTEESPVAKDPQLTLNGAMFSTSKKDPTPVAATSTGAATGPKSAMKETVSMPAMSAAASAAEPVQSSGKNTQPLLVAKSQEPVAAVKKSAEPLVASSMQNGSQTASSRPPQGAAPAAAPPPANPVTSTPAPRTTAPVVTAAAATPVRPVTSTPARPAAAPAATMATPVSSVPGLNAQEEQLLEVQSLITRGHMLLEESQYAQASQLFKKAKELAKALQNVQLEAKANRGLGAAYSEQPNMLRASGTIYEVAAQLFGLAGDTSDRLSCVQEAIAVYLRQNLKPDALRVMETYDKNARKSGLPAQFEDRIKALKAELGRA